MGAITDVVLRETLEQMGAWSRDGLTPNVAVNLDPKLLTDVGFPDRLAILMQQYGVDGSKLTLEITETAAMMSPEMAIDILTRLRIRKVNLAIDDFGAGYSSMKQLFYMPFSELKIDGSFISELRTDSEARTIVDAMISLGHNLHMSVCAECVESREALDFLEKAGCDKVQGFLFSKPVKAAEFAKFMVEWRGLQLGDASHPADFSVGQADRR
jgi:EAL domain-containing protein (putative c-di-GMP-specific phosphodiesterase class I)